MRQSGVKRTVRKASHEYYYSVAGKRRAMPRLATIRKKQISLVLSGGAVHGIAHIAIIEELEAAHVRFQEIIGSSVGSLVGLCLAAGKTAAEIREFVFHSSIISLFKPVLRSNALIDSESLVTRFLDFVGVTRFEDLVIPFLVNATNINTGEERVFSRGLLKTALQASIAFPGIFPPLRIGNAFYVDGGVAAALPVHLAAPENFIFAIDISRRGGKINNQSNVTQILQAGLMMIQQNMTEKILQTTMQQGALLLLRPDVGRYNFFSVQKTIWDRIYADGKEAFAKAFPRD